MRKLMVILVFILGSTGNVYSQVIEYTAREFSMKFEGEWYPWEENHSKGRGFDWRGCSAFISQTDA